ncbi:MAG: hypothetical protein JWP48_7125 [Actinoallomurus sp.]|jgi:hypothetical protein|nr:hypothetical protein [Actinoallomurus sp.]
MVPDVPDCPDRRGSRTALPRAQDGGMCRSIKTLRPMAHDEAAETVTDDDVRAAALQYVRKVSGFRKPAGHNEAVFDRAVDAVTRATTELLADLEVRGARARS